MDADRLESMREGLARRNTKALVVLRNDRAVLEWYAAGHGPDSVGRRPAWAYAWGGAAFGLTRGARERVA